MQIRDRVRELRRVRAGDLRPHPNNWRVHPASQHDAMRGMLAEIGYAGALLARELPDGALQLLDGHLRAELTPDSAVPVLLVDLDDAEAAKLLALYDPLAAMAQADEEALASLAQQIDLESAALQTVLDNLLASADAAPPPADDAPEPALGERWQVIVECDDEDQQRQLYERLAAEGYSCRLQVL